MKKKSKILALICALCLAFGTFFVGCGDGNKDGFDDNKSSSKKEQQSGKEDEEGWSKNY
ncbi:MAG: hypothetical protein IJZ32_02495 [Clostridia bacterium]|nr:hypothetical protein [Clostridia bacterium]